MELFCGYDYHLDSSKVFTVKYLYSSLSHEVLWLLHFFDLNWTFNLILSVMIRLSAINSLINQMLKEKFSWIGINGSKWCNTAINKIIG